MKTKSVIGQSIPRLESKDKVTGKLSYLDDLKIRGMLHAKVLRSPLPHARIVNIDDSRARKLAGVAVVLTRDDIIDNPRYHSSYGPVVKDQSIVAIDKVRFVGDPVAAVAATRPEIAEEALELIEVDYEELPTVMDPEEALAEGAPLLHDKIEFPTQGFADLADVGPKEGTNICTEFLMEKGDIEKGFAESDHVFEDVFTCAATQHATMESFTAIAQFEDTGKLTIWSTTQNPFVIREQMAEIFKLPLAKVRVISPFIGGGYGSKLYPRLEPLAAALAIKANRPVGITLTREEVFQTITKHGAQIYLKTGVKKDGTLVARHCRIHFETGAYADIGPRVAKKAGFTAAGPHKLPHVKIESSAIYTNKVPAGAFRGFGVSQTAWAHESQMGMIARALDMDPLEFTLANLVEEGSEFATGERLSSVHVKECVKRVADAIEWGQESPSEDPTKVRGKGLACHIKATITPSLSMASIRLNEDGSATVYMGTVEIGQGSDTVMAQIASEELAIPVDQIFVLHSDTDICPYELSTNSSRSTFHVGRAVQLAAQDIKQQLACIAGPMIFETSPEDIVFENQTVRPKDSDASQAISYQDLLTQHFEIKGANLVGLGKVKTSLKNAKGELQSSAFWDVGAVAADVEVDLETGSVRIVRFAAAVDAGKALNPEACDQQVRGAAISGIGQALLEELVYQDGLPINPNFLDYNLPRFLDIPEEIISILVEEPHPDGPYGAMGVGEASLIPAAPAIANAIQDATDVRVKGMPITPERVFKVLREKQDSTEQETTLSQVT